MFPTSPIKNLQVNSFQQQFYKVKSLRLEAQIQELKRQNQNLTNRLKDTQVSLQILKEENFCLQEDLVRCRELKEYNIEDRYTNRSRDNRSKENQFYLSRYESGQSNRNSSQNVQIQKFIKHIRILKNQHEVQVINLKEEIRRLKRQNTQLQKPQIKDVYTKLNQQRQVQSDFEIQSLRKQIVQARQENRRQQQEKKNIKKKFQLQQKQLLQLKVQVQNTKSILNSHRTQSQFPSHRRLEQYLLRTQNQKQKQDSFREIQQVSSKQEQITQIKQLLEKKQKQLIKVQIQLENRKKKQEQNSLEIETQTSRLYGQLKLAENRIKSIEEEMKTQVNDFKSFISKLSPLLKVQHPQIVIPSKASTQPSLSLLEILLAKYKIQVFQK